MILTEKTNEWLLFDKIIITKSGEQDELCWRVKTLTDEIINENQLSTTDNLLLFFMTFGNKELVSILLASTIAFERWIVDFFRQNDFNAFCVVLISMCFLGFFRVSDCKIMFNIKNDKCYGNCK